MMNTNVTSAAGGEAVDARGEATEVTGHDSPAPGRGSSRRSSKANGWRARFARRSLSVLADEEGAATAEYAIVIMAAVALAGVLVAIMRSGEVQSMLLNLVQQAFSAAG